MGTRPTGQLGESPSAWAEREAEAYICGMVVLDSNRRAAMILRMGPFSTSVNFGLFAARPLPVVAAVAAAAAGAAAGAAAAAA